MADRNEILRNTLRQPTARLTESEAHERVQRIREASLANPGYQVKGQSDTPNFVEFKKDWQLMMQREREY